MGNSRGSFQHLSGSRLRYQDKSDRRPQNGNRQVRLQGDFRMFQVMIVAKISTGAHLAVTSQLAQCDTKEQADALCEGVEKQNKESRALPGFSAATIKLY